MADVTVTIFGRACVVSAECIREAVTATGLLSCLDTLPEADREVLMRARDILDGLRGASE